MADGVIVLEVHPATGKRSVDEQALRAVTAALLSCEDVITRARANGAGRGLGLRGGTVTVTAQGPGYHLALHEVRWTQDLSLSGSVDWPGRAGTVRASVTVSAPQGLRGRLELQWPEGVAQARANASGVLAGKRVAAEAAAP